MKTLKKTINQETKYLRIKDEEAIRYVNQGYSYCPKSEWKKNVRDFGKEEKSERKAKKNSKNDI